MITATNKQRIDLLTTEDWNDLQSYARVHGRNWKSQLRTDWMNNATLRVIRNKIGPSGLAAIRLNALDTAPPERETEEIHFRQLEGRDTQTEKVDTIRSNVSAVIGQIATALMDMNPDGPETAKLFLAAKMIGAVHRTL